MGKYAVLDNQTQSVQKTSKRPIVKSIQQSEVKALVRTIPSIEGSRTLELPCGDGSYAVQLAEAIGGKGELVCYDPNPSHLRTLSKRLTHSLQINVESVLLDPKSPKIIAEDNFFDVIVWHLNSTPNSEWVQEISRVLKPNGTLVIHQPPSKSPAGKFLKQFCQISVCQKTLIKLAKDSGLVATEEHSQEIPYVFESQKELFSFIDPMIVSPHDSEEAWNWMKRKMPISNVGDSLIVVWKLSVRLFTKPQ